MRFTSIHQAWLSLIFFLCIPGCPLFSQDYSHFTNTLQSLNEYASFTDSIQRHAAIDKWWQERKKASEIPLIVQDSIAFLYRGHAHSVDWMGDFNGWGYDKEIKNKGHQLGKSNVWIMKASFPKDARLDYKIVLDGGNWILDPDNPHQQWSGIGGGSPNSELRMPEWKMDPMLISQSNVSKGETHNDILIASKILGYQITYTVYLPHSSDNSKKLPVLYVTDGYEYMHPKMGNMITVLDNMIATKKIKPIVVVFVDNREPVNRSNNRRMNELTMNKKYLDFFTEELLPAVEQSFPVSTVATERGILGNSIGGLAATYFAFSKPHVFGLAGIQSPAFYTKPQIFPLCTNASSPNIKISMTAGLIHDTSKDSRKMSAILNANSCVYHYREINDGHSWGNWRNQIDFILTDLFGIN